MKLGLKLWSTNTGPYFNGALQYYAQGVFDFIELYIVPGTLGYLDKWKSAKIPIAIHAPHSYHGVNLAARKQERGNRRAFQETLQYAMALEALYTVAHPGIEGSVEETIRQLNLIAYPDLLIENKPYIAPLGDKNLCRGATFEEVGTILHETGCGFCLDIGHAICTANALNVPPYVYLAILNTINPFCYHLSDNSIESAVDAHMHLGTGSYDLKRILGLIDTTRSIVVETNKDFTESLDDFVQDIGAIHAR